MSIDNFDLISSMFDFSESDNMFFHCQIVQRAKDHKEEKVREGAINTYFIRSAEQLMKLKDEIILLCEYYKARAYINVASKKVEQLQLLTLTKIANDIGQKIIRNPRKCLNSAAGELKSAAPKWIVDVDDITLKEKIEAKLFELYEDTWRRKSHNYKEKLPEDVLKECIYAEIPTKQGCHLIVKPFNTMLFSKSFPSVDIHKNSMGTLLYYPDSINSTYCCSECGGTNVQVQAWVDANTSEYLSDVYDDDSCWCEDCQKHTTLKECCESK